MRGIAKLAAVAAMAAPLALFSAPIAAHASAEATGDAAFRGTASLPTFPCPPPPPFGSGPCSGSFTGSWSGSLSGVAGSSPFTVAWSTSNPLSVQANFSYYELQCLDGTETALGVAQGSGTAVAGPGEVQGKLQNVGETFPRDITGVSVAFSFSWTRVGNSAVISFSPITAQVFVAGSGWVTVLTTPQTGTATFVPTQSTGTGVPSCANPLTGVAGIIAGDIPLAGSA